MNYQLIVFDWDGTLMDSGDKIANCFISAAGDVGINAPDADLVKSYVGINLSVMFENLYPDIEQKMVDRLVDRYREHWLNIDHTPMPLYPGVIDGLKQLYESGFLLSIATGKSRRGLDRVLKQDRLDQYFVYTRCADESRSKPHPQMLLDILEFTGQDPKQSIMIGDTTFDMEMAGHAGMTSMGVAHGYHTLEDLEFVSHYPVAHSFSDIVQFFTEKV